MLGDAQVTVTGRLGIEPELRFTPAGKAVVNFTIGTNSRVFDRAAGEWKQHGDATWHSVSAWGPMAENIAESLGKGDEVTVVGALTSHTYEDREGVKRVGWNLTAETVAVSLKFQRAKVLRATRQEQPGVVPAEAWSEPAENAA
jgi:single-strand DNA-binding protein